MLAPLGVDDAESGDEVGEDHEGKDHQDVGMKVRSEQCKNEASEDNVENVEEEPACSLADNKKVRVFLYAGITCRVQSR